MWCCRWVAQSQQHGGFSTVDSTSSSLPALALEELVRAHVGQLEEQRAEHDADRADMQGVQRDNYRRASIRPPAVPLRDRAASSP
jgi:hypothetical protein